MTRTPESAWSPGPTCRGHTGDPVRGSEDSSLQDPPTKLGLICHTSASFLGPLGLLVSPCSHPTFILIFFPISVSPLLIRGPQEGNGELEPAVNLWDPGVWPALTLDRPHLGESPSCREHLQLKAYKGPTALQRLFHAIPGITDLLKVTPWTEGR